MHVPEVLVCWDRIEVFVACLVFEMHCRNLFVSTRQASPRPSKYRGVHSLATVQRILRCIAEISELGGR